MIANANGIAQLFDTLPPHSIEAEAALLGSILLDPCKLDEVADIIGAADLYLHKHRTIYEAMRQLHAADGTVDTVALIGRLERREVLDEVGGVDYLVELAESVPSATSAAYYARQVADYAERRRLILCATDTLHDAHKSDRPAVELREAAAERLTDTTARTAKRRSLTGDDLNNMFDTGLHEGFGFDAYDLGFLVDHRAGIDCPFAIAKGSITAIGAETGFGKSALVNQAAWALAMRGDARVLFANVELAPALIMARQIARMTGRHEQAPVHPLAILRGSTSQAEAHRAAEALEELRPALGRVVIATDCRHIDGIRREIRKHDPDIVVLDYIQRIKAGHDLDTRQSMNTLAEEMRRMADDGLAVVAVSAMNRQWDKKSASGFRESSEVEYGADFAYTLAREEQTDILHVVKNRFGALGDFYCDFDAPRLTWEIGARCE